MAALQLLGVLPLKGKVVSGDAMFTHRDVRAAVIAEQGDYVLPVKDNPRSVRTSRRPSPSLRPGFPPVQAARR